jgi:hypothetical protein
VRLDATLVDQPVEHLARPIGGALDAICELRRLAEKFPLKRQPLRDMDSFFQVETDHPLCIAQRCLAPIPFPVDLAASGKLQRAAPFEIDEKQTAARIECDIAQRVEEEISSIVRPLQRPVIQQIDEARATAAMGDIDAVSRIGRIPIMPAGDEEGVGARQDASHGIIETRRMARRRDARRR